MLRRTSRFKWSYPVGSLLNGLDWRHWILSHLVWIVGVGLAILLGHSLLAEHDARLLSDATVATLQKQIATTNAEAAQKVQIVTKIVHDVKTPSQAIIAIPQLTDVPLNARPLPDSPIQVAVDALPLVNVLGQAKTDKINLAACESNLKSQADVITTLKKKPAFWQRVKSTAKAVGIGVGIGLFISGHL